MFGNRVNISLPLVTSLAAIGIAGLVVLLYLANIAAAVFGPGTGDIDPDARLAQYVNNHEQDMEQYADRLDGRSVFYIPPIRPPSRPIVSAPPVVSEGPKTPPPPPPPVPEVINYTGPTPIFAIGSEVWFERPRPDEPQMRLRVGETAHGVKLVSVSLPSFITVEFRGKEFELDLLGKQFPERLGSDETEGGLLKQQPSRDRPTPGIEVVQGDGGDDLAIEQNPEPTRTASDLELPRETGRPQPTPSEHAFTFERPGEPDDVADDDDAPDLQPAVNEPDVEALHGPPIPDELLGRYTNASTLTGPRNDESQDALPASTTARPAPPRDLEAEDSASEQDPEAAAEAQAGDTPELPDDPTADDPEAPPER